MEGQQPEHHPKPLVDHNEVCSTTDKSFLSRSEINLLFHNKSCLEIPKACVNLLLKHMLKSSLIS